MHQISKKSCAGRLSYVARLAALATVGGAFAVGIAASAQAGAIQTVFVIAMENHNWTQPPAQTSPQQIFGNPAAPYINSLVTPGNPNAAQVSYASNYQNAGVGIHPSEPNYIWQNGGSNFGVFTDADPSAAAGNIITAQSFTGQLTQKGVSWNNYEEDVQYSTSPLKSVSGIGGVAPSGVNVTTNPYNGTLQYNYAVKHNPMAFFTDSQDLNVKTFAQLTTDLANNTVAQYNWRPPITAPSGRNCRDSAVAWSAGYGDRYADVRPAWLVELWVKSVPSGQPAKPFAAYCTAGWRGRSWLSHGPGQWSG